MTLNDFIKMLAEVDDTSGLSKNNIIERIKTKLERIDLQRCEDSRFNINHIFTTHSAVETTLLHFASKSGYENIVRALIEYGAYVDAWDSDGCTPLHFAAKWNHTGIVNILIENGANVNARDNDRHTPLHLAAEGGNENIVRTLIEHGAYVDAWDNDRNTPLHFATRDGNENVVRALIEHGACVNVWDSCGHTPLHFANDHESIRGILIENGAYVSKQEGYSPLHFAVEWGCKDVMSFSSRNRSKMEVERVEQVYICEKLEALLITSPFFG